MHPLNARLRSLNAGLGNSGFSLLEVMVSVGIMTILLGGIASISSTQTQSTLRAQGRLNSTLFQQDVAYTIAVQNACATQMQLVDAIPPSPAPHDTKVNVKVQPIANGPALGANDEPPEYQFVHINNMYLTNWLEGTAVGSSRRLVASLIYEGSTLVASQKINTAPVNLATLHINYDTATSSITSCSASSGDSSISITIENNTTNFNLNSDPRIASAKTPLDVELTIFPGVTVGSTGTGFAAVSTGTLPPGSTLKITNQGYILGSGGSNPGWGLPGNGGGPAITLSLPVVIDNSSGVIYGGGGGGGGGLSFLLPGGVGGNGCGSNFGNVASDTVGGAPSGFVWGYNGPGGQGGCWGQPGADSTSAGGPAGAAIISNGNAISWIGGSSFVKGPIL